MGLRIAAGLLVVLGAAWAFQRPFREYPGQEYTGFEVPAGSNEQTEFVMGRLMFPASPYGMFGGLDRYYDWRTGHTGWTNDYPRADRHFVQRSEEHTSELQSLRHLVCRLLLEKKEASD